VHRGSTPAATAQPYYSLLAAAQLKIPRAVRLTRTACWRRTLVVRPFAPAWPVPWMALNRRAFASGLSS